MRLRQRQRQKLKPSPSLAVDQTQQIAKEREVVSQLRVDVSRIDKVMDFARRDSSRQEQAP